MKTMTIALATIALTFFAGTASFADDAAPQTTPSKHENKTPINEKAAHGVKENNAAVANGDLSSDQGHALNHKDHKIETAEQKNADMRHGLVSPGDHAKFNKKAKHVNKERAATIEHNEDMKEEKKEDEKK
jgi:hypothetical protein